MRAFHPTDAAARAPGEAVQAVIRCHRPSISAAGPTGRGRDRPPLKAAERVGRMWEGPLARTRAGRAAGGADGQAGRDSDGTGPEWPRRVEDRRTAAGPCGGCTVRDRALCGGQDDGDLAALEGLVQRRRFAAGDTVMWADDEALVCANVVSGVLKMVAATPDGREQIVGLLHAADFVGQPYADRVDFTVTALTDAELCTFPRRHFERVLEEHPRMGNLLLRRTLNALHQARRRMLTLARLSAPERVAGLLLDMAARAAPADDRASPDRPMVFDLPLTRGQMADVLGMTIETVSRQLTRLKGAGVLALSGSRTVTIKDARALRARAGVR